MAARSSPMDATPWNNTDSSRLQGYHTPPPVEVKPGTPHAPAPLHLGMAFTATADLEGPPRPGLRLFVSAIRLLWKAGLSQSHSVSCSSGRCHDGDRLQQRWRWRARATRPRAGQTDDDDARGSTRAHGTARRDRSDGRDSRMSAERSATCRRCRLQDPVTGVRMASSRACLLPVGLR